MIVLGFGSLGSCKKRYGSSIFCGSLPTDQLGDDAWPITVPTLGVYGNREILHTDPPPFYMQGRKTKLWTDLQFQIFHRSMIGVRPIRYRT